MVDAEEQRDIDARWEAHAKSLKAKYQRMYLIVPLVFICAGAGVFIEPVLRGAFPTPAPHLIAICLAVISVSAACGMILLLYRNRPTHASLFLTQPSPTSRGALALREFSRIPQTNLIVLNSVLILLMGLAHTRNRSLADWDVILVITIALLGFVALLMAFVARTPFTKHDEFFIQMRARAMQIGFWTALTVLLAMSAATSLGVEVVRFLPFVLAITIAVPCLSFVALTARGGGYE